jgi:hypothetical protein
MFFSFVGLFRFALLSEAFQNSFGLFLPDERRQLFDAGPAGALQAFKIPQQSFLQFFAHSGMDVNSVPAGCSNPMVSFSLLPPPLFLDARHLSPHAIMLVS